MSRLLYTADGRVIVERNPYQKGRCNRKCTMAERLGIEGFDPSQETTYSLSNRGDGTVCINENSKSKDDKNKEQNSSRSWCFDRSIAIQIGEIAGSLRPTNRPIQPPVVITPTEPLPPYEPRPRRPDRPDKPDKPDKPEPTPAPMPAPPKPTPAPTPPRPAPPRPTPAPPRPAPPAPRPAPTPPRK
jgi:hypothetical protein